MTAYLLDSSVLIGLSRNSSPRLLNRFRDVVGAGAQILVCEPVAMEFLAGVPHRRLADADRYLNSFGTVPIDSLRGFRSAGNLYASLRSKGVTVRGLVNCLIAVTAMSAEGDVVLVHDDRDFEAIAQHVPLRHERWSTTD
jgi:predicted nucleic acid-binding protein